MISNKLSSPLLWILTILLLMGVSAIITMRTNTLQRKIIKAEETISKMKKEHEAAITAANEAYEDRKIIYEWAKDRLCEAEKIIGQNSDFCDMDIPDDFRMLWEDAGDAPNHSVQPTH